MSNKQGFRSLSFFESNIIDPDPYLQQCRKKYAVISLCIGVERSRYDHRGLLMEN